LISLKKTLKTRPSFFFDENKTYVIAGGGLGGAIADWMVNERGAKNLILLSRSGMENDDTKRRVNMLREAGAVIEAPKCDISVESALKSVLQKYKSTMPPIGGCIQASMVLRVSLIYTTTLPHHYLRIQYVHKVYF
jgi:short-subunit dehydrogenase